MEILGLLLGKLIIFAFVLACLYLLKEVIRFIRGLYTGEYELGKRTLLWIGLCIAHIVTTLITGFII